MTTIFELVDSVENGEIEIPEFQREFVWSDAQVRDLVESVHYGYPIGSLTLYKLPRGLKESRKALYWVLDGQQRLLSFDLAVNGSVRLRRGRTKGLWIWFNPGTKNFAWTEPPRQRGKEWVKLSDVLKMNSEELAKFLQSRPTKEWEKIHALWLKFQHYDVLIHTLSEDLDLDRLGDIFVRANFAGTRVKGTDVYSTMVAVAEPGMVEELREFTDGLRARRLGEEWDIDYGIVIRTYIAFLTNGKVKLASRVLDQAKRLGEILENKKNMIQDIKQKTENGIEKAIELLMNPSELAITSSRHLPTQNVLVTMAYYLGKSGGIPQEERRGLLAWFVLASYFARYTSAAETRLNEDLSVIEEGKGYRGLISNLEKREGDLKNRLKEDISRGLWSRLLLYSMLRAKRAKDPINQQELTTTDVVVHHIFPRGVLSGVREDLINDIGNITLTTMSTNSSLSSERPENYIPRIPQGIREDHLIPDNPDLWKIESYEQFLKERKELLKKVVDDFWENFIL